MAVDTPVYSAPNNAQQPGVELRSLPLVSIDPSPLNPRKHFDEAGLQDLTDSIRMLGVQQPIVVRAREDKDFGEYFEIIMGERRYRAAKLAELKEIPALVRTDVSDAELVRLALEENTRRRDLSAVEEAEGYFKMLELEPSLTQEGLAKRLGVSQSKIANSLRLLKLPPRVMVLLMKGELSGSHGITLCSLTDMTEECILLAEKAAAEAWPQSRLETEVRVVRAQHEEKQSTAALPLEEPAAADDDAPAATGEGDDGAAVPVTVDAASSDAAIAPVVPQEAPGTGVPMTPIPVPDGEEGVLTQDAPAPGSAPLPPIAEAPAPDALTRPIEPSTAAAPAAAPATPAPSPAPAAAAPATNAATPTGAPRKAMTALIWEDQNEWLVGQGLSVMSAIDRLRELNLSSDALGALRTLTQMKNDNRPGEPPLSPAEVLDVIVITRAEDAGIVIEDSEGAKTDE